MKFRAPIRTLPFVVASEPAVIAVEPLLDPSRRRSPAAVVISAARVWLTPVETVPGVSSPPVTPIGRVCHVPALF